MLKNFSTVTATAIILSCSLPAVADNTTSSKPAAKFTNADIDPAQPGAKTAGPKIDSAKPTEQSNGWEITLKENPMGRMTWFISPMGAKMISPILSMVVNSPTGKIFLFSSETRRYAEYVDQNMMRKVIKSYNTSNASEKYKWTPWSTCGTEKLKGQSSIVFLRHMLNPPEDKGRRLSSTYDEKVWIAPFPDSKISKFIGPIAKMFVDDLPMPGVAVKRTSDWQVFRNGKLEKDDLQTDLEMLNCRPVALKPTDFKVPAGYQKARSETDVLPEGLSFGLH